MMYNNSPVNANGESRDFIEMTAYGAPYNTAAEAAIYTFGIGYTIPVDWGMITSLQFYNNYAYMDKSVRSWEDNQPWLGPQWTDALATGNPENGWESRFNINFGYY